MLAELSPNQQDFFTFGPVDLDVTDRTRSLSFWRDVIGLRVVEDGEAIALGTEADTLIVLHPVAISPALRGHSGLYHRALHRIVVEVR